MKNIFKILLIVLILASIVYAIFFHSKEKLIYEEKCKCDKTLTLKLFETISKNTRQKQYTFKIIDTKGNVKNEINSIWGNNFDNSILHWDCENRKLKISEIEFLSF